MKETTIRKSERRRAGRDQAPLVSTISRISALSVGSVSGASAVIGYVVLLLAARTLDQQQNAEFLTFWAVLFAAFGVMSGISTESTRAAGAARVSAPVSGNPRMGWFGLALGVSAGLLLLVTGIWWGQFVFGAYAHVFVPVLAITVACYSGHAVLTGVLGGLQLWSRFSTVVGGESLVRLLAVAVAVLAGAQVVGLAVAAALGAVAWIVVVVSVPAVRRAWNVRADVPVGRLLRTTGHACVAAASSAALVVGFPVLLRLTTDTAQYLDAAALILAISLTRAPVMIPLNAYQGVAITYFMANRDRGLRAASPIALVILLVSSVGAVAAWLLGPWLMEVMLGPGYRVSGTVLGGLTFDAGLLALLTMSGALCLSFGRHRSFSLGWIAAAAATTGLLFLPLGIETKTLVALSIGPVLGIAVHVVALKTAIFGERAAAPGAADGGQVGSD